MRTRGVVAVLVAIVLGLSLAGVSFAQTKTTVDVLKFEVISVDGNNLVVRDQNGTREINVPDDFRFTIDGKKMSVKELRPGMKGTATVTTQTTIVPVTVTEIREGTVVDATDLTVTVRTQEGLKRFRQSQLDDRGVQILKDGKVIQIRDLRKYDVITATIISKAPPVLVTEKEVQATLAQSQPPAAAPAPAAAAPAATAASSAAPATSPPPSEPATSKATQPPPAEGMSAWVWYLLIAIVIALVWFFAARKKKN